MKGGWRIADSEWRLPRGVAAKAVLKSRLPLSCSEEFALTLDFQLSKVLGPAHSGTFLTHRCRNVSTHKYELRVQKHENLRKSLMQFLSHTLFSEGKRVYWLCAL